MSQANPLFGRKTELIWDGKYDDAGQRVAPLRVALPFQTVETVNETAQKWTGICTLRFKMRPEI